MSTTTDRNRQTQESLRLLVFCTVETGLDAVDMVLRSGAHVVALVGLAPSAKGRQDAAGWIDVAQYAQRVNVPFIAIGDYSLRSPEDWKQLDELTFDLIWVAGWQRLIPKGILELSKLGGIGSHGSPWGISGGRGRSPQNWALMLGCHEFHLSLFRLTPEPDAGDIISQRIITYNLWDSIQTSYKKVCLAIAEMVGELVNNPGMLLASQAQQSPVRYLPQRLPSDGVVDWFQPKIDIYNHCRALTHPYPGLRTGLGNQSFVIWDLIPFDDCDSRAPGFISRVFLDGSFLVSAGDGRLLVRDYEVLMGDDFVAEGVLLDSVPFRSTMSRIFARHLTKHPEQQLIDWEVFYR